MKVGASYYPELYTPEVWRHDLEQGRAVGLTALRCGEFAWSMLEPSPGKYTLDWVKDFMDLAHELGYTVIWCTPSATPPPRFFTEFPDLTATTFDGIPMPVGIRRNYTPAHAAYKERCAEMAFRLGRLLKDHPALGGWQIDNELAGDGFTCWGGPVTQRDFQAFLRDEYMTVEKMNASLGGGVWSEVYTAWDEIPIPGPYRQGAFPPGLRLAFRRYRSTVWQRFYEAQYNALKKAGVTQRITTNFFNLTWHIPFDLWDWRNSLDAVGSSHYLEEENATHFQLALLRGVGGASRPLWILEQKAGQQRHQNAWPDDLEGRTVRQLCWSAEMGVEYAIYWHLRQHSFGCEVMHGAVLGHDGGLGRVARAIQAAITITKTVTERSSRRDLGLYFSFRQQWGRETRPGNPANWDYRVEVENSYFPALPGCRLIGPQELEDAKLRSIVVPLCELDDGITPRLIAAAQGGATIVLTADYAQFNRDNVAFRRLPLAEWKEVIPQLPDWELLGLDDTFTSEEGYPARLFYAWPYGKIEVKSGTAPSHWIFPLGEGRLVVLAGSFDAPSLEAIFRKLGVV